MRRAALAFPFMAQPILSCCYRSSAGSVQGKMGPKGQKGLLSTVLLRDASGTVETDPPSEGHLHGFLRALQVTLAHPQAGGTFSIGAPPPSSCSEDVLLSRSSNGRKPSPGLVPV